MKVEIFSDVVCPFCWIGKKQFELALEQFEQRDQVEVIFRSFELDPNADKNSDLSVIEMLMKKYSMSREQALESNKRVAESAARVGLNYEVEKAKHANSFDAHRLIHFATKHDKGPQAFDLLHEAYFSKGQNINDPEVLLGIAKQLDLDVDETKAVLESLEGAEQVRADENRAREIGVTGVPFFVFNDEYGVSGAQGTEQFLAVLNQVL